MIVFCLSWFLVLLCACSNKNNEKIPIANIEQAPPVVAADTQYANVFKPLDGVWQGEFYVYRDRRGQVEGVAQPAQFDSTVIDSLPLELELVIDVRQSYRSQSPYFQRVEIRDTYTDAEGNTRVEESRGVNKVQNGQLWCVVAKPDETVIHAGSLEGEHTIIWQRSVDEPLKIEYFRETVLSDRYAIIGWGYYGDDDPELRPEYWFEARYHRVEEKK